MTSGWLTIVTLLAALGCALMAGLFFAFSVSVMRGLARIPPAAGIAAMNSINKVMTIGRQISEALILHQAMSRRAAMRRAT